MIEFLMCVLVSFVRAFTWFFVLLLICASQGARL